VIGVYPNGDLAIIGNKDVDVNHERQVLTIAGIVDLGEFMLSKSLTLEPAGLKCAFQLARGGLPAEEGEFLVEFNLTALTDKAPDRYLEAGGQRFVLSEAHDFRQPADVSLDAERRGMLKNSIEETFLSTWRRFCICRGSWEQKGQPFRVRGIVLPTTRELPYRLPQDPTEAKTSSGC